jgi:hypothetical protein
MAAQSGPPAVLGGDTVSKVVIDDALITQLNCPSGSVEVCDSTGRMVGYAVSAEEFHRLVYAWAKAEFAEDDADDPIDDDDDAGSMTTPELLAYLESLGQGETGGAYHAEDQSR